MFTTEQQAQIIGLVHQGEMTGFEASVVTLLAEMRDSLNRLVELAESDYAEDEERLPRSLGER